MVFLQQDDQEGSEVNIAELTYSFLATDLGAPFFILDPNKDLDAIFTNPPASRYFNLGSNPQADWFRKSWPNLSSANERDAFVNLVDRVQKQYVLIPPGLLKNKISAQELCFISFPVGGKKYIAVVMLNAATRTLSNFDPVAVSNAIEQGEFYHAILDNLHDSIGLFELDEQEQLRVMWLNDSAKRYVEPVKYAIGHSAISFLPKEIHTSWRKMESSLCSAYDAHENLSCTFVTGYSDQRVVCEIHFYPVKLKEDKRQFLASWFNITKKTQKETAENQQKQDFYNLVENSPDLIARYDANGKRTYVNKAFEVITGVKREDVLGKLPSESSGIGKSAVDVQKYVIDTISSGEPLQIKLNVEMDHGRTVIHETRLIPEFDHQNKVKGVLLIARDITQEELAIRQTAVSEKQFRTLVENSPDYISRFNTRCQMLYANPVVLKLFECEAQDILGLTPSQMDVMLHRKFSDHAPHGEHPLEHHLREVVATQVTRECEVTTLSKNGEVFTLLSLTPEFSPEGELISVLTVGKDITELKAYQERVEYLSKFDPLTELPNRVNLLSKVSTRMAGFVSSQVKLGLIVLGIDHFKNVNDSFGYDFGDKVLKTIAQRLQAIASSSSYLARLGGDEFGVLLTNIQSRKNFEAEVGRMSKALNESVKIDGSEVMLSVSIGACMYPDDANDLEDLVRYADSALFAAKSEQRGGIRFYSQELTEKALQRMEIRNSIRQAILKKEFKVYLQPKIHLENGRLIGAEALVRWQHPVKGLIFPDEFIPVAEELGLVGDIDMLVLEQLCNQLVRWQGHLNSEQRFAVNMSALQFSRKDLVATIQRILQKTGCDTRFLELEITEGVLLDHCELLSHKIQQLKSLGFTIALDDFGTGYSSLSYLSRYPIDVLKIDRSFVMDMTHSQSSQVLVKTIVSMAQNLNMKVVAEGVEYSEQEALLNSYGVDIGQGYLYAKPMPIEEFSRTYSLP